MNVGATSIEQSNTLLKLGVNPNTADLCWDSGDDVTMAHLEADGSIKEMLESECPELASRYTVAWSAEALIDLLPSTIEIRNRKYDAMQIVKDSNRYAIMYGQTPDKNNILEVGSTLLDAAYNTLIRLIEENKIEL